jgi:predicted secreted protein
MPLMLLLAAAMPSAYTQSAYKCYTPDGTKSWLQNGRCATPSPYGDALYKCVLPSGAVSIQQEPCNGKAKMAWRRNVSPELAQSPAEQARRVRERAQHELDARELARRVGNDQQQVSVPTYLYSSPSPEPRSAQLAQCQQAKANRESVLNQVGLARTYDLLRQLDDAVYQACHGL